MTYKLPRLDLTPSREPWWGAMRGIIEWARGVSVPNVSEASSGLVPAATGNTAEFLRGDGTWASPPAAPEVTVPGANDDVTYASLSISRTNGLTKTTLLTAATTDGTKTEMFVDGASIRATVPSGGTWFAELRVVAREEGGANHATYHRRCCIHNIAGTTALEGTVETLGTDVETDAAWEIYITADDTNDALKVEVEGGSGQNIRWIAELSYVQVSYA